MARLVYIRRLEVEYEIENKLTESFIFGSLKTFQTGKISTAFRENRKKVNEESRPVSEFIISCNQRSLHFILPALLIDYSNNIRRPFYSSRLVKSLMEKS